MDLATLDFKAKILVHTTEYTIGNTPSSTSLLKKVIQLMYMDTNAMTSHIKEKLMGLYSQLLAKEQNITELNYWICIEVGKLAERGEECGDPYLLVEGVLTSSGLQVSSLH